MVVRGREELESAGPPGGCKREYDGIERRLGPGDLSPPTARAMCELSEMGVNVEGILDKAHFRGVAVFDGGSL